MSGEQWRFRAASFEKIDFRKSLFTGRNVIGFSNLCPPNNEARQGDHDLQKQFQNSVS